MAPCVFPDFHPASLEFREGDWDRVNFNKQQHKMEFSDSDGIEIQ